MLTWQNIRTLVFVCSLIAFNIVVDNVSAANIWYEDNNLGKAGGMPSDFIVKFDNPESFQQAAEKIDVYMMRANVLAALDDHFVEKIFLPFLVKNNIELAINAGGATWMQRPGRKKLAGTEIALLRRLKRLGVTVDYISLQSVLSKIPRKDGKRIDYSMDMRIEDVVAYAKAVMEIYPKVNIGIIDALPSHGKEYRQPYRRLMTAMSNAGLHLSYIHLDMPFDIPRDQRRGVTWKTVREVENYVEKELGLVFGYFTTSRRSGHESSKAYHNSVIADLDCYAGSGGTPDDYIIASWFPYPEKTIPEYATGNDYPTMRTVLEFGRKLEQIEQGGGGWADQRVKDPDWSIQCGISTSN